MTVVVDFVVQGAEGVYEEESVVLLREVCGVDSDSDDGEGVE